MVNDRVEMRQTYDLHTGGKGFLTQDMFICSHRFDGLIGMDARDGSNDNGLKPVLCKHVFVRFVYGDTEGFKVLLCPIDLGIIWRADCHQLGSGRAVKEVQGMPFPHTTQSRQAYPELWWCHWDQTSIQWMQDIVEKYSCWRRENLVSDDDSGRY